MTNRLIGYVLIIAALVTTGAVFYLNSNRDDVPLVFSPPEMLGALWERYKAEYVEAETGRTIDKQRDWVTTSEGQSYTMLRAVWMGDKETFDNAWGFAKDNLQHADDSLFAWLWGEREDGTFGVLEAQGGETSASDADVDIALALLFAYARWQDPAYRDEATAIIDDIWEIEVVTIAGTPYLAANNHEKSSERSAVLINPSYFAPYAYRIFAQVDREHPWQALVESSYDVLGQSAQASFDSTESVGLPPNWMRIDRTSGALLPAPEGHDTNFGYEAMRIPWRLALDWQWFGEERAQALLRGFSFLSQEWQRQGSLSTVYTHGGAVVGDYESPSMYGGAIGHFMAQDEGLAQEVYEEKLLYLFSPGINAWHDTLSYWDDNWAWFGIALYQRLLPNLTENSPLTLSEE